MADLELAGADSNDGVNAGTDAAGRAAAARRFELPLGRLADLEGAAVPSHLPAVIDAHVHLFPPRMFDAIWRWFETYGWPIRYRLYAEETIEFLIARGITHMIALHYAHKPGMARSMNSFMADLVRQRPEVTGSATVYPGEDQASEILREGFAAGLRAVKLHCHVQCFAPDDARLSEVYQACIDADVPLIMHAGREPSSPAYKVDTHAVCNAVRTREVLKSFPKLRLLVPHLGADEFEEYEQLLEQYDNLWLDTTMMLGGYFEMTPTARILTMRPERLLYGTDFPNLPYAWDRELQRLTTAGLSEPSLPAVLAENAIRLFRIGVGQAC
jgi:uncharacterized protein